MVGILTPAGSDLRTSSLWSIMLEWLIEAHRLGVQCGVPFQGAISFPQYQDLELPRPLVSPFPHSCLSWSLHATTVPNDLSSATELHLDTIVLSENRVYFIPQ